MKIRVILADDHRIVREGLRALLQAEHDIEVVAMCGDGRETVASVKQHVPDIVLMDIQLPDLNGIEATEQITNLGHGTRVVALSSHTTDSYIKGMHQAGATGYVAKHCAGTELVAALRTVARGGVYLSPELAGTLVSDYVALLAKSDNTQPLALSNREREVLQLVSEGATTATIAMKLHIGVKTVESHRKRVMDKLDIRTVAGLTKYAIRTGLTSADE